jgi:hypothetical protein
MRQRGAHFGPVGMKNFILGRLYFGKQEAHLSKFKRKNKHKTYT